MGFSRNRIEYKSREQILTMRKAGLVTADVLDAVVKAAQPGTTTAELNTVAESVLQKSGATSNFKGYHGFPAVICTSVNEEVVHGIPGNRVIREGDIVSVDGGAIVAGWHGDSARTVLVGEVTVADRELSKMTEAAMWAGIAALSTAQHIGEVGGAIEDYVRRESGERYGLIRDFIGHGIGTAMHQPPNVLNYRARDKGAKVKPGLCVCVEPMLVTGNIETETLEDDWTVVTRDGSHASHWEHTVAVHDQGIWVLTALDGGVAGLKPFGVTPVPLD